MKLFTDSYSTTAGTATDTRKIIAAIKETVVKEDLDQKPESTLGIPSFSGFHPLFITGSYPAEEKIPAFAHPIYVAGIGGKNVISTDLRFVLKKPTTRRFDERIMDRINFEYLVSRTCLDLYWISGRQTEFKTGFVFAARVYASWVGQILRTIGLNPEEVLYAETIALAFYHDLCTSDDFSNNRRAEWVAANSVLPFERVAMILTDIPEMYSFSSFLDALKTKVQNYQLVKINTLLFLQKASNSWYGLNRAQVIAVSVEHPPTWTALVHHSLSSKSFKNCLIAQLAQKATKKDGDAFMRHYHDLFGSMLRVEHQTSKITDVTAEGDFNYDIEETLSELTRRLPIL